MFQIYAYALLFIIGGSLSVLTNGEKSDKTLPLNDEAVASMAVSQNPCEGYKSARGQDGYWAIMCNCDLIEAIGINDCGSSDDDDDDTNPVEN